MMKDFSKRTFAALLFLAAFAHANERPNIIVILADDQGWGDLSGHGNENLATPNLDRLANQGVRFNNFYVQPVCSPTRAEFLTGRYYPRGGVYSTGGGGERLDADEETIAEVFQKSEYATGAFGKWHNGTQAPYHPTTRGFDEYYGFTSGHWGSYFDAMLDHNGDIAQSSGYLPDVLTEKAMQFVSNQVAAAKPFFAYLALPTPHSPMQATDADWKRFEDKELAFQYQGPETEDLDHTRAALAMVENIDYNVGRMLSHIQDLDIENNTIVVYFSDNGPNGWRWNGGMRGRKGSTDEGGTRSPLFVRWPTKIDAGREIDAITSSIDLLPTLGELANISWTPKHALDGISMADTVLGLAEPKSDRILFNFWNGKTSARNQRFRLDFEGNLYDIETDREQAHPANLAFPETLEELSEAVEAWKADVLVDFDTIRPLTVGFPGLGKTQLPARDAAWTGGIERSNQWPNCSYLLNWTQESESIYWDALVGQSGEYKATLYYACPEEDIGSTIKLSSDRSSTSATITVAHNPPAYGMEHDRIPREESYVKDFATMDLGILRLEKGQTKLELTAPNIPGKLTLEFRLLVLEKVSKQ